MRIAGGAMKTIIMPVILIGMIACQTPERAGAPAGLNTPVWINDDILEITVSADADQAEKRKAVRGQRPGRTR
jgi:hypothetical protein